MPVVSRIFTTSFASVIRSTWPRSRESADTKEEVGIRAIQWLTGFDESALGHQLVGG